MAIVLSVDTNPTTCRRVQPLRWPSHGVPWVSAVGNPVAIVLSVATNPATRQVSMTDTRSSLIHFACIGVAPPQLFTPQAKGIKNIHVLS